MAQRNKGEDLEEQRLGEQYASFSLLALDARRKEILAARQKHRPTREPERIELRVIDRLISAMRKQTAGDVAGVVTRFPPPSPKGMAAQSPINTTSGSHRVVEDSGDRGKLLHFDAGVARTFPDGRGALERIVHAADEALDTAEQILGFSLPQTPLPLVYSPHSLMGIQYQCHYAEVGRGSQGEVGVVCSSVRPVGFCVKRIIEERWLADVAHEIGHLISTKVIPVQNQIQEFYADVLSREICSRRGWPCQNLLCYAYPTVLDGGEGWAVPEFSSVEGPDETHRILEIAGIQFLIGVLGRDVEKAIAFLRQSHEQWGQREALPRLEEWLRHLRLTEPSFEREVQDWLATPLSKGTRSVWAPRCREYGATDEGGFLGAFTFRENPRFFSGWPPDRTYGTLDHAVAGFDVCVREPGDREQRKKWYIPRIGNVSLQTLRKATGMALSSNAEVWVAVAGGRRTRIL